VPEPRTDLEATISALWRDARPRVIERVATLEEALAALRAGTLDADLADRARREAHKLAGALGTFGMPLGTDRARDVERGLAAGAGPEDEPALTAAARDLRRIAEAGPGG
jgi:HPt (histidine-containing phosphotransfer) domain-containing protein